MDHPAAALLVEDSPVVVVEEGHGVFLAPGGVFGGGSPGEECNDDGVSVFCVVPRVVDDASKLALVVGWIVGDANALGKKSRVIGEVKGTGQETTLA